MSYKPELFQPIMAVGFDYYQPPIKLSNGEEANNKVKIDYDSLKKHPLLLSNIVDALAELAEPDEPKFVAGVPDGATGIANLLSLNLSQRLDRDVYPIGLSVTDKERKIFGYQTPIDEDTVSHLKYGVLCEDVFRTGANTSAAIAVLGLEKVSSVVTILDRGKNAEDFPIEIKPVVAEYIPEMLPPNHDFVKQFAK